MKTPASPPANSDQSKTEIVLKAILIGLNISIISIIIITLGEILIYSMGYSPFLLAHNAYFLLTGLYFTLSGFYFFFGDSFSIQFLKGVFFGNKQRYLENNPSSSYLNGTKYFIAGLIMFIVLIIHYKIVQIIVLSV